MFLLFIIPEYCALAFGSGHVQKVQIRLSQSWLMIDLLTLRMSDEGLEISFKYSDRPSIMNVFQCPQEYQGTLVYSYRMMGLLMDLI